MNTEDNLKEKLDDFLTPAENDTKTEPTEEVVIQPKTGIVERIEKKLITPDGRILLI